MEGQLFLPRAQYCSGSGPGAFLGAPARAPHLEGDLASLVRIPWAPASWVENNGTLCSTAYKTPLHIRVCEPVPAESLPRLLGCPAAGRWGGGLGGCALA